MNKTEPCKCGAEARIRYKDPFVWVECKKKCGMKTGVYHCFLSKQDILTTEAAIEAWNRLVRKDG